MHNEFTAIFERDGDWHVAYCPEIPGANGLGRTKEEARKSLADAIALILEDRRADAMRGAPASVLGCRNLLHNNLRPWMTPCGDLGADTTFVV